MERLRVVIAEKDDTFRKKLAEMVTRAGYLVVGEAGDGLTALKKARSLQPEIVLTSADLPVMSGLELARIIEDSALAAVVLLAGGPGRDLSKEARWIGPVLVKPFDEFQLQAVMEYAYATFMKMVSLEKEVSRLKNELETRKLVEKAKGILMKSQGLTEEEAFRRIQQQSMRKRTTMKKIAEAIIMAHELEKL